MLNKRNVFLIFFLLLLKIIAAQSDIHGRVTDSLGSAVLFAPVALIDAKDSAIIKGGITDNYGVYYFDNIRSGRYMIKVVAIGFQQAYSSAFDHDSLSTASTVIPDIGIHFNTLSLSTVEVSTVKNIVDFKNGNIIINVENSPLAIGNSVFDLLKRMPGVNVDNENKISIQGRTGVKILLDGRIQQVSEEQMINLLKSMDAGPVEKIEILKNPPVKYDASGTAGMINIISKKVKLTGFSGSVNVSVAQGFYNTTRASMSLNYKAKKAAFYLNANGSLGNFVSNLDWTREFDYDTATSSLRQQSLKKDVEQTLSFKAGTDFMLNKRNTLGFNVDANGGKDTPYEYGTIIITNDPTQGFNTLNYSAVPPDKWQSIAYNFYAEHRFDTSGTTLSLSAGYDTYLENAAGNYENNYFDQDGAESLPEYWYRNNNRALVDISSVNIDFKKEFAASLKMEAGAKGSYVNQESDFVLENKDNVSGEYIKDTLYTNKFSYEESNLAAYVDFYKEFEKVNIELGLRGENTMLHGFNETNGFDFSRNYFQLFPNVSFDYSPSEKNNWQLSYNRRIDRPGFNALNPFKWYTNKYTSGEGNPLLKPQISNTVELTYGFNDVVFNTVSYSRIVNYILFYTIQNDENRETVQSIGNIEGNDTYAYDLFIQYGLTSWLNVSLNASASYVSYYGKIEGNEFKNEGFSYSAFANAAVALPWKMKLEAGGNYFGPRIYGIGSVKSNWLMNIALKKSFLKDKLNLTIGVNDIFHSNKSRNQIQFENQNWRLVQTGDTRRIKVSISYNFGKIKVQTREKDDRGEKEQERLKH
jgi:iron complex outermembrane recepter protein